MHRVQRQLPVRRAAGVRRARGRRAASTTGHYARIVEHRGRLLLRARRDEAKDQSYMLGRLDPALLSRLAFPLGEQTKAETRAQARRAGLAAAGRAREPGGVLPRRRRLPGVPRAERLERRGADRRRERARARPAPGPLAVHPGQRKGLGRLRSGAALRTSADASTSTLVVGPRAALATTTVEARGRLFVPVERVEAKLRYRSRAVGATVLETRAGSAWSSTSRHSPSPGAGRRALRGQRRGGVRPDRIRAARLGSPEHT